MTYIWSSLYLISHFKFISSQSVQKKAEEAIVVGLSVDTGDLGAGLQVVLPVVSASV